MCVPWARTRLGPGHNVAIRIDVVHKPPDCRQWLLLVHTPSLLSAPLFSRQIIYKPNQYHHKPYLEL